MGKVGGVDPPRRVRKVIEGITGVAPRIAVGGADCNYLRGRESEGTGSFFVLRVVAANCKISGLDPQLDVRPRLPSGLTRQYPLHRLYIRKGTSDGHLRPVEHDRKRLDFLERVR